MNFKMLHTCIRVMDLEKSVKFYKEALGLQETRRSDFPEHKFTLVFLADADNNYEIEITYNYDPEEPYVIGDGFSHFALGVKDLEGSRDEHIKMGYEVTRLMGLPGSKPGYYFLNDPDGYEIEIIRMK